MKNKKTYSLFLIFKNACFKFIFDKKYKSTLLLPEIFIDYLLLQEGESEERRPNSKMRFFFKRCIIEILLYLPFLMTS